VTCPIQDGFAEVLYDSVVVGSWPWSALRGKTISYETVRSAREEVKYVVQKAFRSTMFWD